MSVNTFPNDRKWVLPFFSLWLGQAFSLLGSQLVQFALVWWLTKTTGSATVLATAALMGFLPSVFLGPVAGALVDRWNRRLVMMAADGLIALATVGLALLFLTGQAQVWHVYLLLLVRAAGGAFHWPAAQASTSLMVPQEHLSRVQGLNQMLNGGMNILAAPLGALLLELLPLQGVLAVDVITAALAILPLVFIRIPQPERSAAAAGSPPASVWGDVRAGVRYVMSWPGLMLILGMAMVINLVLNPAFTLLPLLVKDHFGGQAIQLASLESGFGLGAVAGGLLLGVWGGFRRRILTSMLGLLLVGAGTLAVGLMPAASLPLAAAALFLVGGAMPLANGPLMAVVQSVVAPEMQGRVFTLISSLASAITPLGLIIAGPVASELGVQAWFVLGGVLTGLMGVIGVFIPAIMNIEGGRVKGRVIEAAGAAPSTSPGD